MCSPIFPPTAHSKFDSLPTGKITATKLLFWVFLKFSLHRLIRNLSQYLSCFGLNAPFDTLDHSILLRQLETTFGVSGISLFWSETHLSDREPSVTVDGLVFSPSLFLVSLRDQFSDLYFFYAVLSTSVWYYIRPWLWLYHACWWHITAWQCTTSWFSFCSAWHSDLRKWYFVMDAKQ